MQSSSLFVARNVLRQSLCKYRLNKRDLRSLNRCLSSHYSTAPLPAPEDGAEKTYSPKIQKLVEDISQLNLIEVADLNELLKKTLKIQEAPVMAMGMAPAGPAKVEEEAEEEESSKNRQVTFSVKLVQFDAAKKIELIKEIKNLLPDTNLVQAKKFVESAPVFVKKDLTKEEAEALKASLEKKGAKAEVE